MTVPTHPTDSADDELNERFFQPEHQSLVRALLTHSAEGLLVVDAKGDPLFVNKEARRLLGTGLTQAVPTTGSEHDGLFHPDMRTRCPPDRLPLSRALRQETVPPEDFFVRHAALPEGRHVQASAQPVHDPRGALQGAILRLRDIHVQRQVDAEQHRTERRLQFLVENAQEGVWMLNLEYRTFYANRSLAEMLGYTPEELMGRSLFDFIKEEYRELTVYHVENQKQGASVFLEDFPFTRKDGTTLWTIVSAAPAYDRTGEYLGHMALITNITRRREAEQQVRQLNEGLERRIAERTAQLEFSNRELEAFAYSVAHDLRAPLRSISNFTTALGEDCADQLDATGQDYLRRIRASSQRMSELIDGILTLSRVSRTELQETDVDLSALARSVSEQLQRWQPTRSVRFQLQEGLVDRGDVQLLRSVLENLLGNAWKFTRERAQAHIAFGTLPDTGSGRVYFVRDDGAGFDMEYQAKLFGVFQRLHTQQEFEGTGVGLATAQRILRRHGGRIWAEGHVGQGATFFFTLHEPPRSSTSPP